MARSASQAVFHGGRPPPVRRSTVTDAHTTPPAHAPAMALGTDFGDGKPDGAEASQRASPRAASPRAASPRLTPPRLASRRLASPRATSPRLAPPCLASRRLASRAASPRLASPPAASPRLASPRLASPRLASRRLASRRLASPPAASTRLACRLASRRLASRRLASPRLVEQLHPSLPLHGALCVPRLGHCRQALGGGWLSCPCDRLGRRRPQSGVRRRGTRSTTKLLHLAATAGHGIPAAAKRALAKRARGAPGTGAPKGDKHKSHKSL